MARKIHPDGHVTQTIKTIVKESPRPLGLKTIYKKAQGPITGVSYNSVRSGLTRLRERGEIIREGQGALAVYRMPEQEEALVKNGRTPVPQAVTLADLDLSEASAKPVLPLQSSPAFATAKAPPRSARAQGVGIGSRIAIRAGAWEYVFVDEYVARIYLPSGTMLEYTLQSHPVEYADALRWKEAMVLGPLGDEERSFLMAAVEDAKSKEAEAWALLKDQEQQCNEQARILNSIPELLKRVQELASGGVS